MISLYMCALFLHICCYVLYSGTFVVMYCICSNSLYSLPALNKDVMNVNQLRLPAFVLDYDRVNNYSLYTQNSSANAPKFIPGPSNSNTTDGMRSSNTGSTNTTTVSSSFVVQKHDEL